MKNFLLVLICFAFISVAQAQLNVSFIINTTQEHHSISPYIYGSNGQSADDDENITARRIGGNRLTGYNWENNASNAGADWYHQSDDYLTWVSGISAPDENVPNIVYKAFHDTSLTMNCYSLVTLPMAGFVAKDKNGVVDVTETAPSSRFCNVINRKGSALSLQPDTNDQNIYIDECLNNLIHQYGLSNSPNGIRGFSMDNEYALWNSTHPRIHPLQPTIGEVISKSVDLARTIKSVDANAEVFGPADYGYASFLNFQTSSDWSTYSSYGNFINAYLRGLKLASDTSGFRLLDAVDVHWYPEAQGFNSQGNLERVVGGSNDRGVAIARMQCPRTLWDSTYIENSWIGQWFSPCVYLHALQNGISAYYPSTKLAFTEFDYGGADHISGGIAIADVLGLFGKYNVYMGTYWGALDNYVSSAYKIYRNYDGSKSTFGDIHVFASTDDVMNSSVYSSIESLDTNNLHIVAINKNYDSTMTADFQITSPENFTSAAIWGFDSVSNEISQISVINNIQSNHFVYSIPPLSVYHFVLSGNLSAEIRNDEEFNNVKIFPNPVYDEINIGEMQFGIKNIIIENLLGEKIYSEKSDQLELKIDASVLSPGIYFIRIIYREHFSIRKFIKS